MSRSMQKIITCLSAIALLSVLSDPTIGQSTQTTAIVKDQKKTKPLKVGSLRELQGDPTCQGTGGIMTYAETRNYRVYICADKTDRTQPRYYRSRDRNGAGSLNLKATDYNPRQMRYFEFKNKGFTYILQMPMSQIPNPVLSIQFPNGRVIEEPVLRYLARS